MNVITCEYLQGNTFCTLFYLPMTRSSGGDKEDAIYMLRKLKQEYEKWGLTIKVQKTAYPKIGDDNLEDLDTETEEINGCKGFKYLVVTLSSNGQSAEEINNKIGQGKKAIQLNSVLWNDKITRKQNKSSTARLLKE